MMVEALKQAGSLQVSRDVLKIPVNTGDNWSAQCFRVAGETASGSAALRGFCALKSQLTSPSWMERVVKGGRGVHRLCACGESWGVLVLMVLTADG